jgi:hypothetical protein
MAVVSSSIRMNFLPASTRSSVSLACAIAVLVRYTTMSTSGSSDAAQIEPVGLAAW